MFRVVNNLLSFDQFGHQSLAHGELRELYDLALELLPTLGVEGYGPEIYLEFSFSTLGKGEPIDLWVEAFQSGFSKN